MPQTTALQEFQAITETIAVIHDDSGQGNAFYSAMRKRQETWVMTPGQVALLKDKATVTLQQMFNEAAAEEDNKQSMLHYALRHASRDPLAKICSFVNTMAALQKAPGRREKDSPQAAMQKQNEQILRCAYVLSLCLDDMVSNFKIIMPPGDKKDLYTRGLAYKESVIPELQGILPRLAQEFGIADSRLTEIKAEADKNYDRGTEHLRRIDPVDWQKQGLLPLRHA